MRHIRCVILFTFLLMLFSNFVLVDLGNTHSLSNMGSDIEPSNRASLQETFPDYLNNPTVFDLQEPNSFSEGVTQEEVKPIDTEKKIELPSVDGPFVDPIPSLGEQMYSSRSPRPSYSPPPPISGPESLIVLLVYFTDLTNTRTSADVTTQVFTTMDGYYREVSYDQTWLSGNTAGWFALSHDIAYYGEDWSGNIDDPDHDGYSESWWLIRDAVQAADPTVDFSLYDHVMVVHAGNGQETSGVANDIWSVRWSGIFVSTNDGVTITHGCIVPEYEVGGSTLGVMAHEFGHDLGLPDLYDTSGGGQEFVGKWGLMGGGGYNGLPPGSSPAHLMAYCKLKLGWITNVIEYPIGSHNGTIINMIEGYDDVIKIPLSPTHYYLIEHRYDTYLPSSGVIITYCDETLGSGQGIVKVIDAHPGTQTLDDAAYQQDESYIIDINGSPLQISNLLDGDWFSWVRVVWKDESWISDQIVRTDATNPQRNPDIATDDNGSLYIAYESWYEPWAHYVIWLAKSEDGGRTWITLTGFGNSNYDCYNPDLVVDIQHYDTVYVVYEQATSPSDYDIIGFAYNESSSFFMYIDTDIENDRYPKITCDHWLSPSYLYVTYERLMTYDDRDMVVKRSIDHGLNWVLIHQRGTLDFNVYCDLSITSTYGPDSVSRVYIAYKFGADYSTGYSICVDISTNRGSSWTQRVACAEASREKHHTSIAAGWRSGTVVVAWHVYYDSTYLDDIQYAYSTDNGVIWTNGWLADQLSISETYVELGVDYQGENSIEDAFWGHYYHAVYRVGSSVFYKRAAVNRPNSWTLAETVNDGSSASTVYSKPTVTGNRRGDSNHRYPAIAWTDLRGNYDIYYSTRGGTVTILTEPSGLNVFVDDIEYSTMLSFEWIAGFRHNISAIQTQYGSPGVRYIWDNWTSINYEILPYQQNITWFTRPYDVTFTAHYNTEFYLTVSSTHGTTTGEGWYAKDSTAYAGLTSGIVPGVVGERFVFQSWTGDASGTNYAQSNPIIMDGPKTTTANWLTQYYLTVTTTYGTPSGEGWYDSGNTAYAGLDTNIVAGIPGEQFVFQTWTGDASGTTYFQSDPIVMNGPKTATATWQTQYYLTVSTAHGVSSGEGWYEDGSTAYAGVDASIIPGGTGTRFMFLSWAGDASGTNYAQSNPIIMDSPKSASVNWQTEYYLTVSTTYGTPTGAGWYADGTTAYAGLDTGLIAGSPGEQFVFLNWGGDATGSDYSWSDPITMDGPKTALAAWQTQYYLTVTSDHGTPSGEGWYASGSSAYASLDVGTISVAPGEQLAFEMWTEDASGTNYIQSDLISMNGPKNATAVWVTQFYMTVNSSYGSPTSSSWVNSGDSFQASVTSPVEIIPDSSRWLCAGHRVDAGPLTGGAICSLSSVSAPHTISFEWVQQYHLAVQTNPSGLTPSPTASPSGEWFDEGSPISLTAQNVSGYDFLYWNLDGQTQASGQYHIDVMMNQAHIAIAHYEEGETTTPPPPPPPPGIPGFPFEAIVLGVLVTLGIGVLIRRRRRK